MNKKAEQTPRATLGDVLYAGCAPLVQEQEWVSLLQSIAQGNPGALLALYGMAHRPVFTLILRITARLETAEALTIDVFHDVWRRAARYDAAAGSVLGWIMNLTRARTLERLRVDRLRRLGQGGATTPAADPKDLRELRRQTRKLRAALTALTPEERQAIEVTFFAGYTQAEAAVRLKLRPGILSARLHAAMRKLRHVLTAGAVSLYQQPRCKRVELACAGAVQALTPDEAAVVEAHIAACTECRRELDSLRPVVDLFVCWPTDVLRPPRPLQARLALRIAGQTGEQPAPLPRRHWKGPGWEQVAPGIECKLLSSDAEQRRVSMQVRLAPGASYPAHTHAGPEELHLLNGELWIDGRKLEPGDYNYGEPGGGDESVYSETGCTCVLVTSTDDVLH